MIFGRVRGYRITIGVEQLDKIPDMLPFGSDDVAERSNLTVLIHDQLVFGRLGRFLGAGLLCPGRIGLVYMLIVTGLAFDSVRFLILECDDDVGKHELAAITPSIEILAHHGLFYHNIRQNSLRSILQDLEYVGWARPTTHTGPRLYPALRTIASPIMNCSNSETCLGKSHHEWQFHRSGGLGFGMLRPDLQPARNSQWQTRDVYIT